jgi:putative ubiquitin-RnfH superfamily antitoxin RatB of RatAB toxin-antitoxin module
MAPVEAGGVVVEVVVEVAYSPAPRRVDLVALTLPIGSTVGAAMAASGLLARHAVPAEPAPALAVWGRLVTADTPLRMHDRVELLRPLLVDPKEARRQRYRTQAERRPGRGRAAR